MKLFEKIFFYSFIILNLIFGTVLISNVILARHHTNLSTTMVNVGLSLLTFGLAWVYYRGYKESIQFYKLEPVTWVLDGGDLKDIQARVHALAVEKGWWKEGSAIPLIPEKLALIHSEISEALEAYRTGDLASSYGPDGKPEGMGFEMADAVIRLLDLSGALGYDMAKLVNEKHRYNETRSYRHGGKLA